jgi:hypothetical protein
MPQLSPTLLRLCLTALPGPVRELLRQVATCPRCGASSYPVTTEAGAGEPDDVSYDRAFAPDLTLRCRERRLAGLVEDLLAEPHDRWAVVAADVIDLLSPPGIETVLAGSDRAVGCLAWALFAAETTGAAARADDLRVQLAWLLLADDDVPAAREMFRASSPAPGHPAQAQVLARLLARDYLGEAEIARLERELDAAHTERDAFQAATAAILLARHYVRTGEETRLFSLARYVAAAAEAPQLAAPCRASLAHLAEALREADVSIQALVAAAHSLRHAGDGEGEEPRPEQVH